MNITGNLTKNFTIEDYGINQTGTVKLTAEAVKHAIMLQEFRTWLGRPMVVHAWYRTVAYNKSVGGSPTSSHLRGVATDWHTNKTIDQAAFIKYAKKWKSICKKHGVVGEAGLYEWGMHLGSHVKYSDKFYHWRTVNGKQVNNPFKI